MAYDSVRNDRSGVNSPWVMHEMQSHPKGVWPTNYSNSENNNWNSSMVTDNREAVPYPSYPSNYWYPQSHTAGPYSSAYPSGSEVNGQRPYNPQTMPGFPDAVYNPGQYPAGLIHPSNPFYCTDQPPTRQVPYPNQGCTEQGTSTSGPLASHCHYSVSHCQRAPEYPPAPYAHYGDGVPPVPQSSPYPSRQPLHTRPQPDAWPHAAGFGSTAQQQWQPDAPPAHNHYGNPLISPHPAAWTAPSVAQYDPQDRHYPGYVPVNQPMGPNQMAANPGPVQPREFSAPPQVYNTGKEQKPKQSQGEPPPTGPPQSQNPSLARVQQVMVRVCLLQEDVDEFVGHKADKSYRCLEELLTKELLELDSVETNGQESVRQARKEAVQKIQGILDRLEKKAF
ncbi:BAG family molecular chaperone regulator 4 [Brienomyrus brachyistius]|uniref:BAG family molecular chaperone regulator 4 n=1 Tax=Brienomyrus brachyistius TaxID=42636 RepID=UPI0020B38872|nr:BAG family molecular chaperone regulator 4 [Brienomyrus brachyistius]